MCGEMAGDPTYTRILLGMGLQQFSMDAVAILEVKRQIRLTDTTRLAAQVEALLQQAEPEQIRRAVDEINA